MTYAERVEMLRHAMGDALKCLPLSPSAATAYLKDALDELAVIEEEDQAEMDV